MTEGTAVRTKRMGARFFKNPPQPHMCIRDTLKGCPDPCYINVLSWDKVALGMSSEGVPLYGGMKVCPPRTEKKKVAVFAVMANPEILRLHGKNAWNPKERSWLIDRLLDFVEKMNEGVVFNRLYTVLRDRDITGELKEIWMIVQNERAKAQQVAAPDELRRPVSQYAQYLEQQQLQIQQNPMTQQHQHPVQQQQQQLPQMPLQHPLEEFIQQPPQYQPSGYFAPEASEKCESYELSYGRQTQNIMISMKDRIYQGGGPAQQNHSNDTRGDRYISRDPIAPPNPQGPPQNCIGYPTFHCPQMPHVPMNYDPMRQMRPNFPPNVHPNAILNCPPHGPNAQVTFIRRKIPTNYPEFHERVNRMPTPPQHQTPPIQIVQNNPPANYYDLQNRAPPNMTRMYRPRTARRSVNHSTGTKSVVSVDSRDTLVVPPPPPPPPEQLPISNLESAGARISTLQQPHFAVMTTQSASNLPMNLPINLSVNTSAPRDQNSKKPSTINFLKLFRPQDADVCRNSEDNPAEENTNAALDNKTETENAYEDLVAQYSPEFAHNKNSKKPGKPKIKVLKRHISVGEQKAQWRDLTSGMNGEVEIPQDSTAKDRSSGKDADVEDRLKKVIPEIERNGIADKQRADPTRLAKTTTTSLRNTLKILAGGGGSVDEVSSSKEKTNGQVKSQNGMDNSDDVFYTILRKPEATTSQEDVMSEMSQLTINDCRETGEVGTVIS